MNINNLPYSELLDLRCKRLERNVPWHVMPKEGTKSFCDAIGAPYVKAIAKIDSIDELKNINLPEEFVIKPLNGHSKKGVMVLKKITDDVYLERFSGVKMSSKQIIVKQNNIAKDNNFNNRYIIEEYINDIYGEDIPHDFKFFAFQGEIAIIMEVNRNKSDKQQWYFYNPDFSQIKSGKVVPSIEGVTKYKKKTPSFFKDLINLAKRVSVAVPTPFARIDLYYDGKIAKVGEITLTPFYGFPYTWSKNLDYKMGLMWIEAIDRMGKDISELY